MSEALNQLPMDGDIRASQWRRKFLVEELQRLCIGTSQHEDVSLLNAEPPRPVGTYLRVFLIFAVNITEGEIQLSAAHFLANLRQNNFGRALPKAPSCCEAAREEKKRWDPNRN